MAKEISVTIRIPEATHTKVLLKQINKFKKSKTVAEVCALAVVAGIDAV